MLFYISCVLCLIIGKTGSDTAEPRLGNGEDARPGQFPWMVSFQRFYPTQNKFSHDCGGTIIDRRHILTAGHCYKKGSQGYRILVGAHNISESDSNEPNRKVHEICRFHFHPEYEHTIYLYENPGLIELYLHD
ncbi:unnamed protein product [Allacma fusca]|uniref:Peptidase S1 domain-containing protein n=1 Tax=Allacma fusca TaxID=39272 RepID=A0A8J2JQC0_9HEXA|nr:unnamed protein product [Allacma fusca]